MGLEFTIRKSDKVRVQHEKKSDGVRSSVVICVRSDFVVNSL